MATSKISCVAAIAVCAGFLGCGASSGDPTGSAGSAGEAANASAPPPANILRAPQQGPQVDGIVTGSNAGYGVPAYNGGPVVGGQIWIVPIFYGTAWQPNYKSTILSFLGTMSSTSYWQVVQEYGDSAGHHPGSVSVGTPVNETDYAFGKSLTPTQIAQIVQTWGTPFTNVLSSNTIYLVFTADDVNQINVPSSFGEQSGQFCTNWLGWHWSGNFTYFSPSNFTKTNFKTEYAFIGSPEYCIKNNRGGIASAWESSIDGTVVGEAMTGAMHEVAESATDPFGSAWSPEIGDICAWIPGPTSVQKVPCGKNLGPNCFFDTLWDVGQGAPYTSSQLGHNVNQGTRHLVQTFWDVKQKGCAYGPASLDAP
jgi:hypothetical protein